jgi:PncC family amidohydrolase
MLRARRLKLAIAESCTGGLLSSMITDAPGSSEYFPGAIVAYGNAQKMSRLGVRAATLRGYGAVSGECALEMAVGVRRAMGGDVGVGITGIAGPSGGLPGKPVGTVYVAVVMDGRARVERHMFRGGRASVKRRTCLSALKTLSAMLGRG